MKRLFHRCDFKQLLFYTEIFHLVFHCILRFLDTVASLYWPMFLIHFNIMMIQDKWSNLHRENYENKYVGSFRSSALLYKSEAGVFVLMLLLWLDIQ